MNDRLLEYIRTGDRRHLERFCDTARPQLAALVRRFHVDGYDLDDLVQEAFLVLLTWAEEMREMGEEEFEETERIIRRHLRALDRRSRRANPPSPRRVPITDLENIPDDDLVSRGEGDIGCLTLLIAARSECRNDQERELLQMLITGVGSIGIGREWGIRKRSAAVEIRRFRSRMRERFEEF